ncbi:MAG TPA: hypothetical protein VFD74_02120, partial [Thermoleophilia bacterium]|nr:hypothetical protein [Thermoleophilia bacterium]
SVVADAAGVDPALLGGCAAAFAGGAAGGGLASTVVDLRPLADGTNALVLREGAVPAGEVLRLVAAAAAAGGADVDGAAAAEAAAESGPKGEGRS